MKLRHKLAVLIGGKDFPADEWQAGFNAGRREGSYELSDRVRHMMTEYLKEQNETE